MKVTHEHFWRIALKLPEDYESYGKVSRNGPNGTWGNDCSCGCKFALYVDGGWDWLICVNPKSHRHGLLTFEHQGCWQWEYSRAECVFRHATEAEMQRAMERIERRVKRQQKNARALAGGEGDGGS